MKEQEYLKDLTEIRSIMERSARFISLSGLSGVMAGIYALIGAFIAYHIIYKSPYVLYDSIRAHELSGGITFLVLDAVVVLALAVATGMYLTYRKALKNGQKIWDKTSKRLLLNLFLPLVAGGLFIIIIFWRGFFSLISPLILIFYGMALINASNHTVRDVRYLGISEIILGLVAALLPGYGLFFWAFGFGVLHIFYGLVMYLKYDR
ncbi:MAG: hypothetical protein OEX02_00010 [Cyclobacteriaceae bacterium]|nr:hypothetical protein [Cyclobacteriaceae bacterium]